jgi:hypothetical protein
MLVHSREKALRAFHVVARPGKIRNRDSTKNQPTSRNQKTLEKKKTASRIPLRLANLIAVRLDTTRLV